jgi:hypothetical protein
LIRLGTERSYFDIFDKRGRCLPPPNTTFFDDLPPASSEGEETTPVVEIQQDDEHEEVPTPLDEDSNDDSTYIPFPSDRLNEVEPSINILDDASVTPVSVPEGANSPSTSEGDPTLPTLEGDPAPASAAERTRPFLLQQKKVKSNFHYYNKNMINMAHMAPSPLNLQLFWRKIHSGAINDAFIAGLDWEQPCASADFTSFLIQQTTHAVRGILSFTHPMFLTFQADAHDTPNWHQAMNGPNAEGYPNAMDVEIGTLSGKESWIIVQRTKDMNVLKSTWAFKCKWFPDG